MGYRAYSRAERKVQIVATLAIQLQHRKKPEMTMYEIAKSLDIRPSTHLIKILKEMVVSGELQVDTKQHRPQVMKWVFKLPEGTYSMPRTQTREIRLSRAGVTYERLLI
jgi:hypothetical protein